ncbi:unnamed protein product [Vicia faba]|uniref:F-box domain-containing protein n=1 Tax=Vicia faba TaxID=3906 RepID=A0AAV0YD31_VICFA|nr:unnamed protein product [Vicia faba]CAI8583880.1 unnamed protein product [Vicia faba]
MPLPKFLKWIIDFMQSLFQTSLSSPLPTPPVELCNDILFEIFLRLPPEVLPRLSILNKGSYDMINSPLFQTTYWTQKIQLPRLYARVYYQHKLTNQIGFALTNKEHDHKFNKNKFHNYTQVPQIRYPSSYYTRILQWTEAMLEYNHIGPNVSQFRKQMSGQKDTDAICQQHLRTNE